MLLSWQLENESGAVGNESTGGLSGPGLCGPMVLRASSHFQIFKNSM